MSDPIALFARYALQSFTFHSLYLSPDGIRQFPDFCLLFRVHPSVRPHLSIPQSRGTLAAKFQVLCLVLPNTSELALNEEWRRCYRKRASKNGRETERAGFRGRRTEKEGRTGSVGDPGARGVVEAWV